MTKRRTPRFTATVLLALLAWPTAAAADGGRRLRLVSPRNGETLTVAFGATGRPPLLAWRRVNRFFRTRQAARRTIHPRLLRVLTQVQHSFGASHLELVSGYRTRDTWQRDSYHQVGRAADIRIAGVSNRALFDFCLALQRRGAALGCGFYPRGHHVHLDVRGQAALWVDLSSPGTRPRYAAAPRAWLEGHR